MNNILNSRFKLLLILPHPSVPPLQNDKELELLKRKKLLKMQRRLLRRNTDDKRKKEKQRTEKTSDFLKRIFVGRAWEVWKAAEQQHPTSTGRIGKALATLVSSGRLRGPISGEQLYWLFRRIGLPIRLETKIRILENGELKTVAEKLKVTKQ